MKLRKIIQVLLLSVVISAFTVIYTNAASAKAEVDGYEIPIDITVNGVYLNKDAKGYLGTDNVTYVPVRGVAEALGATVSYNEEAKTVTVEKSGTRLVMSLSSPNCYVNGVMKYICARLENGVLYAPARFIAQSLGAQLVWDDYMYEVDLTLPGHTVAQKYVETEYNADDLLWLSRIVTCEAGSVSFNAKIMVANVIINRRASTAFPDTIYGVIFDKKFGVQFPPAHNGKIYNTPSTNTILACKVALGGTMLAPDCLYFTYTSDNFSWVYNNRTLYTTIGNQAFYK